MIPRYIQVYGSYMEIDLSSILHIRCYQIKVSSLDHQTFKRMQRNWNRCREKNHKYANIIRNKLRDLKLFSLKKVKDDFVCFQE